MYMYAKKLTRVTITCYIHVQTVCVVVRMCSAENTFKTMDGNYKINYSTFELRIHAEVDNEEDSTAIQNVCMGLCITCITLKLRH